MAIHERSPFPQSELPQTLDQVSVQAIMQVLQTLPTPITIECRVDERKELMYYRWQAGETTQEHPVGFGTGITNSFVDALSLSLAAALTKGQSLFPPKREYNL